MKQVEPTANENNNDDKSFFSKKKMLESRIEKLRQLEGRVKSDSVCTKDNCTVAIDPRTTQERYLNETEMSNELAGPNREVRERIERFRSS